jgi:hypothetical protein
MQKLKIHQFDSWVEYLIDYTLEKLKTIQKVIFMVEINNSTE